jgi:hypothetical protein
MERILSELNVDPITSQEKRMQKRSHVETARSVITDLWSKHDTNVIPEIFAEDASYQDVAFKMEFLGHEGIKKYFDQVTGKIPDFKMELVELLEIGEHEGVTTVVTRWFYGGTFSDGKLDPVVFRLPGYSTVRLRDGKIFENIDMYGGSAFLQAIGMAGKSVEDYHDDHDQSAVYQDVIS